MTLLASGWLWALPLAAAPVVFHLAWRLRRKRIAMPSLLFFQRVEPRLQARKRLRDLLVLLLRCLVLACAALALTRPQIAGIGGGGAAAVAIVVDDSASMGMPSSQAGKTRLAIALASAGALIGDLGASDRAVIVPAVADPLVPMLPEPIADRDKLRAVLDQVRETEAAAAPAAALARAAAALRASTAPRREIHIFTDLQEHDWGGTAAGAVDLPPATVVRVHRIPAGEASPDAALSELALAARARLAGRPTALRATLTNAGGTDAAVTVSLADDAGHRQSQAATVPARGSLELALAVPAAQAGAHWARVWLEGDRFAGDDQGFVAFACAGKRAVALLSARSDLGALPLALAPAADGSLSGLAPQTVDAARLPEALAARPALVAISWEDCAALDATARQALRTYVEQGGHLALAPRAAAPGAAAPPPLPDWLGAAAAAPPLRSPQGKAIVALDPRAELLRDLAGADGAARLPSARAFAALPLTLSPEWKPVLGLDDGRPVLAARALGSGVVFCSAVAFSRGWSTLPLAPAFLAIAQAMALPAAADDATIRLLAGDAVRVPGASGPARVRSIAGAALDWQGALGANGELPPFARAGVYAISAGGHELVAAVRCDPGEGRPAIVPGGSVPALGGIATQVDDCASPEAALASWRRSRTGIDLAPWLVALALACALAESWLANRSLVRTRQAPSEPMRLGAAA
jgi:hypothetical protein